MIIGHGFIGSNLAKHNTEGKVYYCAGVMRSDNKEDFYKVNYENVKNEISKLNGQPFIYLSSTQYDLNNDYGYSKRLGESATLSYHNGIIYRLCNTFGANAKPNYNSVVSTIIHNIKFNLPICINNANFELEINYIDDVIKGLLNIENKINYIMPVYKVKLGDLYSIIWGFNQGKIPQNELEHKLYETYNGYECINIKL